MLKTKQRYIVLKKKLVRAVELDGYDRLVLLVGGELFAV